MEYQRSTPGETMHLALAIVLAFGLTTRPSHAAGLCLGPSHPAGVNQTTACGVSGATVDNDWIGFDTSSDPCSFGAGATGCIYGDPPSEVAFCWSISSSAVQPFHNKGPVGPGVTSLYLWIVVANLEPFASSEFYLSGDLNVVSVTTLNGFLVSHPGGDLREVRLSVIGCPFGPVLAARVDVAGTVSVESRSWGGVKARYF